MDTGLITALMTAAVALGGSWLVARQTSSRLEVEQLKLAYERIAALEGRVDGLEGKRREDALTLRKLGDHIDTLAPLPR